MATVTVGLLHMNKEAVWRTLKVQRLAFVWILQTEQPEDCCFQVHA